MLHTPPKWTPAQCSFTASVRPCGGEYVAPMGGNGRRHVSVTGRNKTLIFHDLATTKRYPKYQSSTDRCYNVAISNVEQHKENEKLYIKSTFPVQRTINEYPLENVITQPGLFSPLNEIETFFGHTQILHSRNHVSRRRQKPP